MKKNIGTTFLLIIGSAGLALPTAASARPHDRHGAHSISVRLVSPYAHRGHGFSPYRHRHGAARYGGYGYAAASGYSYYGISHHERHDYQHALHHQRDHMIYGHDHDHD